MVVLQGQELRECDELPHKAHPALEPSAFKGKQEGERKPDHQPNA